ncbi:MAG: Fe-S cluster assembly ATPase SufC [Pseudomonadota bacterium]|nr:Fe-S cluster assembly ATPase SufC [Pseudomonadota bacterium]
MFEIQNLHVNISEVDKKIIDGINLKINPGEVHAIMGPNGSGKSTLSYTLSGKDGYEVINGDIKLDDESILELEADERAAKGIFLAFQYPIEIPGVGNLSFMRTALNSQRKYNGTSELNPAEFLKVLKEKANNLNIDMEMLKRPLNVGFSGGEKKRNEILQMALLEPRFCVLDETDSGLDVDAMKQVSNGVNLLRSDNRSFLIITHYQRLLNYIKPDFVHIMAKGKIIKTAGPELAIEVEEHGYTHLLT